MNTYSARLAKQSPMKLKAELMHREYRDGTTDTLPMTGIDADIEYVAFVMFRSAKKPLKVVKFEDANGNQQIYGPPDVKPSPELLHNLKQTKPYSAVELIVEGICPSCLTGTRPYDPLAQNWMESWDFDFLAASQHEIEFHRGIDFLCRYGHQHTIYPTLGYEWVADSMAEAALQDHLAEV